MTRPIALNDNLPNLNTGEPWSDVDLFDLKWGVDHGDSASALASFLCRTEREVRDKALELGYGFVQCTNGPNI